MFQAERLKVVLGTLTQIREEMWKGHFDEDIMDSLGLSAECQTEINRINFELNELLNKDCEKEEQYNEDS